MKSGAFDHADESIAQSTTILITSFEAPLSTLLEAAASDKVNEALMQAL